MIFKIVFSSLIARICTGFSVLAAGVALAFPHAELVVLPIIVLTGGFHAWLLRVAPFEATLPVSARTLLCTRLTVACALVVAPVLVWIVAGAVGPEPNPSATSFSVPLVVKVYMVGAALLALIVPNIFRKGSLNPPKFSGTILPAAAIVFACIYAEKWITSLWIVVLLGAAILLSVTLIARVTPLSFLLVPDVRQSALASVVARDTGKTAAPSTADGKWWRPLAQSATGITPAFGGIMMIMGGVSTMWLFYLGAFLTADVVFERPRTRWMNALPFTHRQRFWILVLPLALPIATGLMLGKILMSAHFYWIEDITTNSPHAYSRKHDFIRETRVPLSFWRPSPDGLPQENVAPWGERSSADTLRILGKTFYNPYSAQKSSSPEFADWQVQRATTALYGTPLTIAEIKARDALPRRVTHAPRILILMSGFVCSLIFVLLFLVELPRARVLSASAVARNTVQALTFVLLYGLFAFDLYYSFAHGSYILLPAVDAALLAASDALPPGLWAPIAVALLSALLLALLAQSQFARSEETDRMYIRAAWSFNPSTPN